MYYKFHIEENRLWLRPVRTGDCREHVLARQPQCQY